MAKMIPFRSWELYQMFPSSGFWMCNNILQQPSQNPWKVKELSLLPFFATLRNQNEDLSNKHSQLSLMRPLRKLLQRKYKPGCKKIYQQTFQEGDIIWLTEDTWDSFDKHTDRLTSLHQSKFSFKSNFNTQCPFWCFHGKCLRITMDDDQCNKER